MTTDSLAQQLRRRALHDARHRQRLHDMADNLDKLKVGYWNGDNTYNDFSALHTEARNYMQHIGGYR